MKKLLLFAALALSAQCIKAQVGIGTVNPDTKVILHIQSKNKGILLPQINDTSVVEKREGSLIYNTETNKFKYFRSPYWISVNPLNADVNDNVTATGDLTVTNNLTVGLQASLNTDANGEVAETGNLTVNGQRVDAPNATVTANTFIGNGTIPVGGIIMWSGSTESIPEGWALCDGQNRTPDLRGRFIVGLSNNDTKDHGGYENSEKNNPDYLTIEATGGNNFVTLNTENVPAHSHNKGTLSTEEAGQHQHKYNGYRAVDNGAGEHVKSRGKVDKDPLEYGGEPAGLHSHPISGETGKTGGVYTKKTKINPPKLNDPKTCFEYICTQNYVSFYSSIDLSFYSNKSNSYDISKVFPSNTYYDYDITTNPSGGLTQPGEITDEETILTTFKASIGTLYSLTNLTCEINSDNQGIDYVNPDHNPNYEDNQEYIYDEKWTTTPIDTRPAYYVLAFIMRIQ